jgi:hypothetical protein
MISMLIDEDSIVEQSLFTWLREQYFADNTTRDAARRALGEVSNSRLFFHKFRVSAFFPPLEISSFFTAPSLIIHHLSSSTQLRSCLSSIF